MSGTPNKPSHPANRTDIVEDSLGRVFHLDLFHVSIRPSGGHAEVELARVEDRRDQVKRRFWTTLARRLDLTGRGSLVKHKPYAAVADPLSDIDVRVEQMIAGTEAYGTMTVMLDEEKMRPLRVPADVEFNCKEVTAQFFLRNIPRVERDSAVRRPPYVYAVWRESFEDDLQAARHPEIEIFDPKEHEASYVMMADLSRHRLDAVHGYAWGDELTGDHVKPTRFPTRVVIERERVPISELSLEPAPPNRFDPEGQHHSVMKALLNRTDGSAE